MKDIRRASLAVLIVLSVGVGGCGQAKDFLAKQSDEAKASSIEEEAQQEAQRLAAAEEAQQQQALAEEEARAEAQAAQEALEAAERQLAEKEALLAEREQQLRQQRALLEEKERLAAEQAAAEQRERDLFERERELEAREVNLAVAEDELRDRAVKPEPIEPEGWSDDEGPTSKDNATYGDLESVDGEAAEVENGEVGYGTVNDGQVDDGDYGGANEEANEGTWGEASEPELPESSSRASLQPGKVMEVEMLETISSRSHRAGYTFSARLVQDLRAEDGTLVIPAGAEVIGEVVEATPLKRVGGQASIGIEFTRIVVAPGESVEIRASVSELGPDRRKDKKKIIGATIAGAILGRVLGGKGSENAVLGAAVGAAAGTAVTARTKGKDAVIPAGEMVALQLEEVVTVEIDMTGTVEPE